MVDNAKLNQHTEKSQTQLKQEVSGFEQLKPSNWKEQSRAHRVDDLMWNSQLTALMDQGNWEQQPLRRSCGFLPCLGQFHASSGVPGTDY